MSYNSNIPQTTDPILQSFSQLRSNFQEIQHAFSDNHEGLTSNLEFAGMHDLLTMRPQGTAMAPLDPTTSAIQIALYNKLVSNIPELFFRPSNNQTPIQLTYPSIKADSSTTQYTFMAGPFVVYGGLITNPTNGQTVTLTPVTTLQFVDLIVTNSTLLPAQIAMAIPTSIAANSFNISFSPHGGRTFDVYYFAIGV